MTTQQEAKPGVMVVTLALSTTFEQKVSMLVKTEIISSKLTHTTELFVVAFIRQLIGKFEMGSITVAIAVVV